MVKEYKQALRTNENEREQLQREKQRLVSQQHTDVRLTTPPRGMTTPIRPTSPTVPDTPSKDLVLEEEPHGAEFEVSVPESIRIHLYTLELAIYHFLDFKNSRFQLFILCF